MDLLKAGDPAEPVISAHWVRASTLFVQPDFPSWLPQDEASVVSILPGHAPMLSTLAQGGGAGAWIEYAPSTSPSTVIHRRGILRGSLTVEEADGLTLVTVISAGIEPEHQEI